MIILHYGKNLHKFRILCEGIFILAKIEIENYNFFETQKYVGWGSS